MAARKKFITLVMKGYADPPVRISNTFQIHIKHIRPPI